MSGFERVRRRAIFGALCSFHLPADRVRGSRYERRKLTAPRRASFAVPMLNVEQHCAVILASRFGPSVARAIASPRRGTVRPVPTHSPPRVRLQYSAILQPDPPTRPAPSHLWASQSPLPPRDVRRRLQAPILRDLVPRRAPYPRPPLWETRPAPPRRRVIKARSPTFPLRATYEPKSREPRLGLLFPAADEASASCTAFVVFCWHLYWPSSSMRRAL